MPTDADPSNPTNAARDRMDPPGDSGGPANPGGASPRSEYAGDPPGLRAQVSAVIGAVRRLLTAHVELAKVEAGAIAGEVGRVALLGGIALAAVLLVGLLLSVGLLLFLGEWLFGSIGWGVAIGAMLLIDIAIGAVLIALGVRRGQTGRAVGLAVLVGVAVGLVLGLTRAFGTPPLVAIAGLSALIAWPIVAGYGVARRGIDTDALRARFYPDQTIETTKETIEWMRRRTPLGPKP